MAYSYIYQGKSVELELDTSVVAIRLDGNIEKSAQASSVEGAGVGPFNRRIEIPGENYLLIPLETPKATRSELENTIGRLEASSGVEGTSPVFLVSGNKAIAPDRVIIGFKEGVSADEFAERHSLLLLDSWDDAAIFQLEHGAKIFDFLDNMEQEETIEYAEPDFVTLGRHVSQRMEQSMQSFLISPPITEQYAMEITRTIDAWDKQVGSRTVSIAVLDEGVDTKHPDLFPAIVGTYDAVDNDSYQEPMHWDGHGTACAGLAAAMPDALGGVRGSGGGCGIFAVRIAYSRQPGGTWVTTNGWIVRAIRAAWRSGASVLSNSWGGGMPSNAIAVEFEKARRQGRDGKGCVIVVAAGNASSPVDFPGNLPNVLTVSASNEFDEAKTPTSRDGEYWWGTNYGPQIDVAAPGVHNRTTDISGVGGYDPTNYTPKFNGTSSATPIVAGACGLLISANPNLTESEVRAHISDNTDKVGQFAYYHGRNDYFGNGRLNVLKALNAVKN